MGGKLEVGRSGAGFKEKRMVYKERGTLEGEWASEHRYIAEKMVGATQLWGV